MSDLVGIPQDRFSRNAAHIKANPGATCSLVRLSPLYRNDPKFFRTDRSGQTVQTQIKLLLEEKSDQGLHCLLFHLHLFDEIPKVLPLCLNFR